jgi:hypothetical protein
MIALIPFRPRALARTLMLTGVLVLSLAVQSGAGAAPAAEKKKGGGETYIQLPTLTATIFRGGGGRGVLTVDVGLDVPNAGLRRQAAQSVPLLQDAFNRVMLSYAPSIPSGAPPNPEIIGDALQRATDQTLGKPGAKLLLGTILEY